MQALYPSDRVILVAQKENFVYANQPEIERPVAEYIGDQLSDLISKNDRIVSLTLGTHGDTERIKGEFKKSVVLRKIGRFSDSLISEGMEIALSPLVGRFDKHVKILLQTCSSMCAESSRIAVGRRFLNFTRWLKIENADIYGAKFMTDEGAYYDTGRIYSNYSQKNLDLYFNSERDLIFKIGIFGGYSMTLLSVLFGDSIWMPLLASTIGSSSLYFKTYKPEVIKEDEFIHRSFQKLLKISGFFRKIKIRNSQVEHVSNIESIARSWWGPMYRSCRMSFDFPQY